MNTRKYWLVFFVGSVLIGFSVAGGELLPPFRVEADGRPIDMSIGNAAPFVGDFDGDGVFDLMLGQRGECRMRIFRNTGSNKVPRFKDWAFFKAGGTYASVPGG